jgi:Flp pilus assembly protein TadG
LAKRRERFGDEAGAVLIIVVLSMTLIVALAAFAIDVATLESARQKAQVAADAGALAGAQDLTNNTVTTTNTTATNRAKTYATDNDATGTPTVTAPYTPSASPQDKNSVKVTVSNPVHLPFAGLFGLGTVTVASTAVATSNLTTALGYFGNDTSDLQDGSATSDGWVNFCADDTDTDTGNGLPSTTSFSSSGSADPQRCPSGDSNLWSINGWTVVHGGVDISQSHFYSPPGTSDQMVDLTGTCVENAGSWPTGTGGANSSGYTNISNTHYDGYCENNTDGELEQGIATEPGATYTVNFYMGANTYGNPNEKAMLMVASNTDLLKYPPMADTDGNDGYHSATSSSRYATVYPLESSSYTSDWGANGIFASEEFVYAGPNSVQNGGSDQDPEWQQETFTFKATTNTTYLGFGALTNCTPDWTSSVTNNYFWFNPSSVESDTAGTDLGAGNAVSSSSTVQLPPVQVHADNQSPWQDQCKYGPGISDLTVTGPNAIELTQ